MGEVRVGDFGVFAAAVEEVVAGLVDDGDVHVTGIPRQTLARFGHETWCDAMFGAEGLDDISGTYESASAGVGEGLERKGIRYTDLKRPALSAICLISANSRAYLIFMSFLKSRIGDVGHGFTYCLEDTRSTLGMPALNPTSKLFARIEYAIVVFLIMDRTRQTVAKHAFCEMRQLADWILLQEACGGGGIAFGRKADGAG